MHFTIDPASGGYRARLWANGKLICWTEVYVHKAGAQNAIRIAKLSHNAPITDRTLKRAS